MGDTRIANHEAYENMIREIDSCFEVVKLVLLLTTRVSNSKCDKFFQSAKGQMAGLSRVLKPIFSSAERDKSDMLTWSKSSYKQYKLSLIHI